MNFILKIKRPGPDFRPAFAIPCHIFDSGRRYFIEIKQETVHGSGKI